MDSIASISRNSTGLARIASLDESKMKQLIYDNFNWETFIREVSALHGCIKHDQESAILTVMNVPMDFGTANHLASVERFSATAGTQLLMPENKSLEQILPNLEDQRMFLYNVSIHVGEILKEDVAAFASFSTPSFFDPNAISPHKTKEYILPPFDQEQGSTCGNMIVLEHYFLKVLAIPKPIFEQIMFFIAGDCLTVVRNRAAQEQQAVDRSEHKVDHLASFETSPGPMHPCMNMLENIGLNAWGKGIDDPVTLLSLQNLPGLENRKELNLRKIDFYAWLHFLEVVGCALVITAAVSALGLKNTDDFTSNPLDQNSFNLLCHKIAATFVLPSPNALEALEIKTLPGQMQSGNAVLLLHDIMTMREMRHAIKHGHPTRMLQMFKYWGPMFHAGGRYNYGHEMMDLVHTTLILLSRLTLWHGYPRWSHLVSTYI
ncbi:hypothetical protein BT96DRAFT_1004649 [Gymnopus androsaceus JB14]|uniref:DUF6589 domain-containing protein n=1 Tax=Gymnopus androsaceus JB14 TaxID=1447944 RepID=A0A6A4GRM7_9AGAR|nr:hypothetical protein BT96DRAFT_1004649 [Gymnopus androsaceus JB14]